jgi:hypothetical protein
MDYANKTLQRENVEIITPIQRALPTMASLYNNNNNNNNLIYGAPFATRFTGA